MIDYKVVGESTLVLSEIESNPIHQLLHLYYIVLTRDWCQNIKLSNTTVINHEDKLSPNYITALAIKRLSKTMVQTLSGTEKEEKYKRISRLFIIRMITQRSTVCTFF